MPWSRTRTPGIFTAAPLASGPSSFPVYGSGGSTGGQGGGAVGDASLNEFPTGPFMTTPAGAALSGTSSLQRAFPERVGGDLFQQPNTGQQPSLFGQAMSVPAKAAALPIAAVDSVTGHSLTNLLHQVDTHAPAVGGVVGFLGGAIERVFSIPAAMMNRNPTIVMKKLWNLPDNTVISGDLLERFGLGRGMADNFKKNGAPILGMFGITGDNMTVGELKAELDGRGFLTNPATGEKVSWQDWANEVESNPLGDFSMGHAAVNENVLVSEGLNFAWGLAEFAPLGWAAGAVRGAVAASRAGQLLSASRGIAAAASGVGKVAALAGRAEPWFQSLTPSWMRAVGRAGDGLLKDFVGSRAIQMTVTKPVRTVAQLFAGDATQASISGVGMWGRAVIKEIMVPEIKYIAATGEKQSLNLLQRYLVGQTRNRAVLAAGEWATGSLEDANIAPGPMGTLHEAFTEVMNNNILSEDALFNLSVAMHFPVKHALGKLGSPVTRPLNRALGRMEETFIDRTLNLLEREDGVGLGKGAVEKLGGREVAAQWVDRVSQQIAWDIKRGFTPGIRARLESTPEAIKRLSWIHKDMAASAQFFRRTGKIRPTDVVAILRDMHENPTRSWIDENGHHQRAPIFEGMSTTLSNDTIIQHMNAYRDATAAIVEPFTAMQTIVLGRAPTLVTEELDQLIARLNTAAESNGNMLDAQFLRDQLYSTPGLLDDIRLSQKAHDWFLDIMNPAHNKSLSRDEAVGFLTNLKDLTEPRDQVWHELTERDMASRPPAATASVVQDAESARISEAISNGVARNIHSAETAKRFVQEADAKVKALKKQKAAKLEVYGSMFSKRGKVKVSISDNNIKAASPQVFTHMKANEVGHFSPVSGANRLYNSGYDVPLPRIGIVAEGDQAGIVAAARAIRDNHRTADLRLTPSVDHPGYLDVTASYHFRPGDIEGAKAKAAQDGLDLIYDSSKPINPRPAHPVTRIPKAVIKGKADEVAATFNLDPDQTQMASTIMQTLAESYVKNNGGSALQYLEGMEFAKGGRRGPGALLQVDFKLHPASEKEVAKRLAMEEAALRGEGGPVEPSTPVLGGKHRTGNVTPQEWKEMVHANMSEPEVAAARRWYSDLNAVFEQLFGDDAAEMLTGFLVSQHRASPSVGMAHVLRAVDELVTGRPMDVGGLARVRIRAAIRGEIASAKASQKIWDFADSALGNLTRSFLNHMGKLMPAAFDVWATRDRGWVDTATNAVLKGEAQPKTIKTGPNAKQYEEGVAFYNRVAQMLNDQNYQGGNWTAAEAQAVGWVRVQRAFGELPQGIDEILASNSAKIDAVLEEGNMADAVGMLKSLSVVSSSDHHLDVLGTHQTVRQLADIMAYKSQQDVIATHGEVKSAGQGQGRQQVIELTGDPEALRAEVSDFLPDGFRVQTVENGIRVIGPEGTLAMPKNYRDHLIGLGGRDFYARIIHAKYDTATDGADITHRFRQEGYHDIADALEGRPGRNRGGDQGAAGQTGTLTRQAVSPATVAKQQARVSAAVPEIQARMADGGFTFDPKTGKFVEPHGFAVGVQDDTFRLINAGDEAALRKSVDEVAAQFPDTMVGGWVDPSGKWGIDPSIVVTSEAEARALAARYKQQGIYNLDTGETIMTPEALLQRNAGQIKGSIEFKTPTKAIIRAYAGADLSTFVHEVGHYIRRTLAPEDQAVLEGAYGIKAGKWEKVHEEKFARDHERYLRDGHAPTKALADVFAKISQVMRGIYERLKGTPLENRIHPDVKRVLDRSYGKVDEPAAIKVGKVSVPRAVGEPIKFAAEDAALLAQRESMKQEIRGLTAEISRTKNDIAEVRQRVQDLKAGKTNPHESFLDYNPDGSPKASPAEIERVNKYTAYIRENYPMFEVEAGPRLMNQYTPDADFIKTAMIEASATREAIYSWGPVSRMRAALNSAVDAYDAMTRPVRGRAESKDTRSRIYEVTRVLGASAQETSAFLRNIDDVLTNDHFIGTAHEKMPLHRGIQGLGAPQIAQQAVKAFGNNESFVANFQKRYGGQGLERMWVAITEAYNPVVRNIQRKIESGGKVNRLQRLFASGYDQWHKQFPGVSSVTHTVAKFWYPLLRFTGNPMYHLYAATEADIYGLTMDGMRVRSGSGVSPYAPEVFKSLEHGNPAADASLSAAQRRAEAMGLHPKETELQDSLMRGATEDQSGATFGMNMRRAKIIERQVDYRRPETIINAIKAMYEDDPAIQALMKRTGGTAGEAIDLLTQDIYGIDAKGAKTYVGDLIKGEGWTDAEFQAMQPLVTNIVNTLQKNFDDLYELHVGNVDRSRIERITNSYWLFWPASYMLKANKWMFKVLTEGAFGFKTNLGGGWALNQLAENYHKRYQQDEKFRKFVDDNADLEFALSQVLPVVPWSDGVALNRLTRYVGGSVGLWPAYSNFDPMDITAWGSKMSDIGPIYALGLAHDVTKNLAKDFNWENGPFPPSGNTSTPENTGQSVPGL